MASALFNAKYARNFDLSGVKFDNNVHNIIAEYIIGRRNRGENVRASDLFEIFDENTPELSAILDLSLGEGFDGSDAEKYFRDCVRTLERQKIEDELRHLSEVCDAETELDKKKQLSRRIMELTVKLKNF